MNKTPKISIILPTYNRGSTLKECLDSVINQSYTNWELIILDDCSTDNTVDVIRSYAQQNLQIKGVSHPSNLGLPHSRNVGIRIADGDLIFFIEDDLVLHPTCIERLISTYTALKQQGRKVIIVPRLIEKIDQNNIAVKKNVPFFIHKMTGEIFTNYSKDFGGVFKVEIGHSCCLYPTAQLRVVGGYAEVYKGNYYREESDLNMRLIKNGYQFYFQSAAVANHNKIETGGCRQFGQLRPTYYCARNHIVFLLKKFGAKSVYMIPCFLLQLTYRTIVRRFRFTSNFFHFA